MKGSTGYLILGIVVFGIATYLLEMLASFLLFDTGLFSSVGMVLGSFLYFLWAVLPVFIGCMIISPIVGNKCSDTAKKVMSGIVGITVVLSFAYAVFLTWDIHSVGFNIVRVIVYLLVAIYIIVMFTGGMLAKVNNDDMFV